MNEAQRCPKAAPTLERCSRKQSCYCLSNDDSEGNGHQGHWHLEPWRGALEGAGGKEVGGVLPPHATYYSDARVLGNKSQS